MDLLGMYPTFYVPGIGTAWVMGIIGVIHVVASHTSVGAAFLFALIETKAGWRFREGRFAGWEVGAGVTVVAARELTLPNTMRVPGQALWDAQASYALPRLTLSLSLSIQNLLNKQSFEPYQYLGGAYVVPTVPRSAYATLRLHF